jgi:RNA polymerase sigma factor (sigma-70 family)
VLAEAAAVDGPIAFPVPVLEALRKAVPCDVVSYHEQTDPSAARTIVWTGEPGGPVTAEVAAARERFDHQVPLRPSVGARKFSDFFSPTEYHRLELYQQVSRPLCVEDMFRLWLDPRGEASARFEFDRPDRGFDEADRVVLNLLRPHLDQFRRNSYCRRPVAAGSVDALTPRERQILELVAQGLSNAELAQILRLSTGTIRKHLENAYKKLGVHTRTAAIAALRTHAF